MEDKYNREMEEKKLNGYSNTVTVFIILVLAGLAVYMTVNKKGPFGLSPTPSPVPAQSLNELFDLNGKTPGTELYYSDKLGVGFTYAQQSATTPAIKISETDNKIHLYLANETPGDWQSIEVFNKDSKISLAEAIKSRFLANYSPEDCFVKNTTTDEQKNAGYESAVISFPPAANSNGPWWENNNKCPANYSETNAVQYFLMNDSVPGKYIFLKLGQDSIASDGTPRTSSGGYDWSHSLKILK